SKRDWSSDVCSSDLVLLHSGLFHLLMNMVAQLYWGLPLELVYGWWRVTVLYVLGAVCASLAGSLAGTKAAVGASGAVFALFGAYFANLFNVSLQYQSDLSLSI